VHEIKQFSNQSIYFHRMPKVHCNVGCTEQVLVPPSTGAYLEGFWKPLLKFKLGGGITAVTSDYLAIIWQQKHSVKMGKDCYRKIK